MKKYSTKITRRQLYDLYLMISGVLEMNEDMNAFEMLFIAVLKELLKEFQSRSLDEKKEYKFTFSHPKALALLTLYRHYDFEPCAGYNKLQMMAMELDKKYTNISQQYFTTI